MYRTPSETPAVRFTKDRVYNLRSFGFTADLKAWHSLLDVACTYGPQVRDRIKDGRVFRVYLLVQKTRGLFSVYKYACTERGEEEEKKEKNTVANTYLVMYLCVTKVH